MWKAQLPDPVKHAIPSIEFNAANLDSILDKADAVRRHEDPGSVRGRTD